MKDLYHVQYSTPLPDKSKVGDPVLLRIETSAGSWRESINLRFFMIGRITRITATQYLVAVPGWEGLRFNRNGGLRRDSACGTRYINSFSVSLLDDHVQGMNLIKAECEANTPENNKRPNPTFHARGASDISLTVSKVEQVISKAAELWAVVPREWKNKDNQPNFRDDKLPVDIKLRLAANCDSLDKLHEVYLMIAKSFGLSPEQEAE
ncbi:hypothetical protein JT321_gp02 [Providencia phage Kokobel1]|uniref:Uncharacterized protein n=1 Tax=Providencia phage Kokobel1 TaxID=2783540 RepID=A0A873WLU0_9CAUD|nr:hypothetical protein JT321_gp02 [Providencia phage Kokobel1]QPB11429.1 hypothetical protein [Providencia phage Kokobel1]